MHLDNPTLLSDQRLKQAIARNFLITHPDMLILDVVALMSQARASCSLLEADSGVEEGSAMQKADASCVLVVEQQQLVGIFTERDVVRLTASGNHWDGMTVAEVMTRHVVTIPESEVQDIFAVLAMLRQYHIRHLPVLNSDGYPIGLLTPEGIRQLLQPADLLRLRLVSEVMTTQVHRASRHTSMLKIAQIMADYRVSCVVITEKEERAAAQEASSTADGPNIPLGIVTERDIVQFHALGLDFHTPADMVMSNPLFCLRPEDSLWNAHQEMQRRHVRRLVVAGKQGELCGIVTQTSLLSVLNPLEVYSLVDVLQQRVQQLETERITLLQDRNEALEQQVQERTSALQKQVECDRLLANVTAQIYKTLDLQNILQITVNSVQQHLHVDRVIVCQFDPAWSAQVVAEAVVPDWRALLGQTVCDHCFAPSWVEPYRNGRIHALDDIQSAEITPCHQALLAGLQVRAHLVVPIVQGGQLWGLLIAQHCAAPRQWQSLEIDILQKLATQLAIAIHQADLHQRTQTELEERQKAETALLQERNFASGILNVMGALVIVLDRQGRVTRFNQTCEQLTGYRSEEMYGKPIWDVLLAPKDVDLMKQVFQQLVSGQFPNQHENYWVAKDGNRRLIAWSNTVLTAADGTVEYVIATGIDITDQRQAEAELRKSEETNRLLVTAIPDLIIRIRRDGLYLDFIPAKNFESIAPFSDMRGRYLQNVTPDLAEQRFYYIEQALQTGQPQVYEYNLIIDGTIHTEEARVVVSGVDEVLVIIRDVTERRKAEEQLRQSRQQYASLAQVAPIGIFRTNTQGNCLYVNDRFCAITGLTPTTAMGAGWILGLHPDDRNRFISDWYEAADANHPFSTTCRFLQPDGTVMWVSAQAVAEINVDGSITGLVGTISNITSRKYAEEALRQSEQRYATLAKAAPVGIFRTDLEGHCLYVNDRWSEIAGLSPEAAKGFGWVQGLHPDDGEMISAEWYRAAQNNEPFRLEYRFQRPDGKVSWVFGQSVPELDAYGKTIGYIGTITDISDRKRSETALRNLVEGTASVTGKDFFTALVRYIADALDVRHVIVSKRLPNGNMQPLALWSDGQLQANLPFDPANLPCGIVCNQGSYCCPEQLLQAFPKQPLLTSLQAESYQGVALHNATGEPIGTLCVLHDQKLTDPTQAEAILRVFAARAAAELERQEAIEALECLNQELEDRVEARTAALRESEARFRLMADSAPVLLWMADTTTRCTFFNQSWLNFTGRSLEGELEHGWLEGIHPDDHQRCLAIYQRSFAARQSFQLEYRLRRHDGEYRWLLDTGSPRFSPDGRFEGYIGSCIDISDRQQAEQVLQRQLSAIEAAIDGIAILSPNDHYIYLNPAHLHLFGYETAAELLDKTWRDLYPPEEVKRFEQEIFPILGRDRHWSGEAIATRKDGSTFAEEVSLTLIESGDLVCVCRDISDRKQAEEQIKASLHEKELLLKEIHHRVKNNLLVVASLLDWQTDYVDDPATLKIFEESQHRIHSMSLIHEKLYQSENLDRIDIGEYLRTLAEHLIYSFNVDPNTVHFQFNLEPIFLNIETATPCGLIVNELISNTLEHAFPDHRPGQLWISVTKELPEQLTISIRDNGIGFPKEIDFQDTESLGLQLVCLLAKQVQGTLELYRENGTEFRLTFTELQYQQRL